MNELEVVPNVVKASLSHLRPRGQGLFSGEIGGESNSDSDY